MNDKELYNEYVNNGGSASFEGFMSVKESMPIQDFDALLGKKKEDTPRGLGVDSIPQEPQNIGNPLLPTQDFPTQEMAMPISNDLELNPAQQQQVQQAVDTSALASPLSGENTESLLAQNTPTESSTSVLPQNNPIQIKPTSTPITNTMGVKAFVPKPVVSNYKASEIIATSPTDQNGEKQIDFNTIPTQYLEATAEEKKASEDYIKENTFKDYLSNKSGKFSDRKLNQYGYSITNNDKDSIQAENDRLVALENQGLIKIDTTQTNKDGRYAWAIINKDYLQTYNDYLKTISDKKDEKQEAIARYNLGGLPTLEASPLQDFARELYTKTGKVINYADFALLSTESSRNEYLAKNIAESEIKKNPKLNYQEAYDNALKSVQPYSEQELVNGGYNLVNELIKGIDNEVYQGQNFNSKNFKESDYIDEKSFYQNALKNQDYLKNFADWWYTQGGKEQFSGNETRRSANFNSQRGRFDIFNAFEAYKQQEDFANYEVNQHLISDTRQKIKQAKENKDYSIVNLVDQFDLVADQMNNNSENAKQRGLLNDARLQSQKLVLAQEQEVAKNEADFVNSKIGTLKGHVGNILSGIVDAGKDMALGVARPINMLVGSDAADYYLDEIGKPTQIFNVKMSSMIEKVNTYQLGNKQIEERNGMFFEKIKGDLKPITLTTEDKGNLTFIDNRSDFSAKGFFGTVANQVIMMAGAELAGGKILGLASKGLGRSIEAATKVYGAESKMVKGLQALNKFTSNPRNNGILGWTMATIEDNYQTAKANGLKSGDLAFSTFLQSSITGLASLISPDVKFFREAKTLEEGLMVALTQKNSAMVKGLFNNFTNAIIKPALKEVPNEVAQEYVERFAQTSGEIIQSIQSGQNQFSNYSLEEFRDIALETAATVATLGLFGKMRGGNNFEYQGSTFDISKLNKKGQLALLANIYDKGVINEFRNKWGISKESADKLEAEVTTLQNYLNKIPNREQYTLEGMFGAALALQDIHNLREQRKTADETFYPKIDADIKEAQDLLAQALEESKIKNEQPTTNQTTSAEPQQETPQDQADSTVRENRTVESTTKLNLNGTTAEDTFVARNENGDIASESVTTNPNITQNENTQSQESGATTNTTTPNQSVNDKTSEVSQFGSDQQTEEEVNLDALQTDLNDLINAQQQSQNTKPNGATESQPSVISENEQRGQENPQAVSETANNTGGESDVEVKSKYKVHVGNPDLINTDKVDKDGYVYFNNLDDANNFVNEVNKSTGEFLNIEPSSNKKLNDQDYVNQQVETQQNPNEYTRGEKTYTRQENGDFTSINKNGKPQKVTNPKTVAELNDLADAREKENYDVEESIDSKGKYKIKIVKDKNSGIAIRTELIDTKTNKAVKRDKKTVEKYVGEHIAKTEYPETVIDENLTPKEASEEVVKSSNNPKELALLISTLNPYLDVEELNPTDHAIASVIGKNVKRSSYIQFGDRNTIGNSMALSYFAPGNSGMSIDQIAQEAEVMMYGEADKQNPRITTDDVVDFMTNKFPNGKDTFYRQPNPQYLEAVQRFAEITGVNPTQNTTDVILGNKTATKVDTKKLQAEADRISAEQQNNLEKEYNDWFNSLTLEQQYNELNLTKPQDNEHTTAIQEEQKPSTENKSVPKQSTKGSENASNQKGARENESELKTPVKTENHQVYYNGKLVDMGYVPNKKEQFSYAGMRVNDNNAKEGYIKTPKGEIFKVSQSNRSAKKLSGLEFEEANKFFQQPSPQFQKSSENYTPLIKEAFDKLIEQLKKPFAKAFKNLNVTTDWEAFSVQAKKAGISDVDIQRMAVTFESDVSTAYEAWANGYDEVSGNDIQDIKTGQPVIVRAYHGTTHEFYTFDSEVKGNIEGHLGKVNYFTSEIGDASGNYQSDGKDLTLRIEQEATRIEDDLRDNYNDVESSEDFDNVVSDYNITDDELSERNLNRDSTDPVPYLADILAYRKMMGGDEKVLDLYLKLNNPVVLGNGGVWFDAIQIDETYLEDATSEIVEEYGITEEEAQDDYSYEIRERAMEIQGDGNLVIEALEKAISDNGYDANASEVLGEAAFEESVDLNDIEQKIRKSELLFDNYDGELASSQVIADFFKNLGFDSIILTDVSDRFPNMGLHNGVSHIHIFNEFNNQIKLADGTNTTFTDSSDIRYMHTANGEIYGAKLPDGTIYINPERLNANTAIHEFSHLWEQLMPSAWKKGVELFKQTKIGQDLFNKLKEEGNYSTLSDNELWSEALNTHVGNYGEWRHANPRSKMGQLKQWLTDTFNKLGEYFGFKLSPDTKLKNFTEGVVKDLLGGKPIVAENTTTDSDTKFNIAGEKGVLNSINKEQNSRNLVIAKEMDDKNISAEQITAVTGWYKGNDGKWRVALDFNAKLNPINFNENKEVKLSEILDYPQLFEYYPELKDSLIIISDDKFYFPNENYSAVTNINNGTIAINKNYFNNDRRSETDKLRAIVHEVQHSIQRIEGFTGGSNQFRAEQIFNNLTTKNRGRFISDREVNQAERTLARHFGSEWLNQFNKGEISKNQIIDILYENTYGEHEARVAEKLLTSDTKLQDLIDEQKIAEEYKYYVQDSVNYNIAGSGSVLINADNQDQAVSSLLEARRKDKNNESAEKILLDTGWFKGKDNKWRYVMDQNLTLKNGVKDFSNETKTLQEVVDYPQLFQYYPELADMEVEFTDSKDIFPDNKTKATFDKKQNKIYINGNRATDLRGLRLSIGHEVQHAIQSIEGTSGGTNYASELRNAIEITNEVRNGSFVPSQDGRREQIFSAVYGKDWQSKVENGKLTEHNLAQLLYESNSGEVESTIVEHLLDNNPSQRLDNTLTLLGAVRERGVQYSIQNKNLIPQSTIADVVSAIKEKGNDEGLKTLQNSAWYNRQKDDVKANFNTENLLPRLMDEVKSHSKIQVERAKAKTESVKEKSKQTIAEIKAEHKTKIQEIKEKYAEKIKEVKATANLKQRDRFAKIRNIQKQAYNDLVDLVTSNSIKRSLTPTETERLIKAAAAILNTNQTEKAVQRFMDLYNKINVSELQKQYNNDVKSYAKVKDVVEQGFANGKSLDDIYADNPDIFKFDKAKQNAQRLFERLEAQANPDPNGYQKSLDRAQQLRDAMNKKLEASEVIKNIKRTWIREVSDRQFVPKHLLKNINAKATYQRMITYAGSSGAAKHAFEKINDKIFAFMTNEDNINFNQMVKLKRIIAIDTEREKRDMPYVDHEDGLNKYSAQERLDQMKEKLGEKKFAELLDKSNIYFDAFKSLLKEMHDNGFINDEQYESMAEVDYQPRQYMQHLFDMEFDENGQLISVDPITGESFGDYATGLSKDQIKSIQEGSKNLLMDDARLLLANAYLGRTKAKFMNRVNTTFIKKDFPKAQVKYAELTSKDPKELTKEDQLFIKYFEELDGMVKENPIIGLKNGKPEFLYKDLPSQNWKRAYYFENGIRKEFFMKNELYEQWHDTMKKWLDSDAQNVASLMSGSALTKLMATGRNPGFALVNTPRDFGSVLLLSEEYSNFSPKAIIQLLKDSTLAIGEIWKYNNTQKDNLVSKAMEYGVAMDFLNTEGESPMVAKGLEWVYKKFFNNKGVNNKTKATSQKILDIVTLKSISNYSEMMFRIAVFDRAIQNKLKDFNVKSITDLPKQTQEDIYIDAAEKSRKVLDFNQGGRTIKSLEAVVPYINAATQGTRVLADAMTERPVDTTVRILQGGVMSAALGYGISMLLIAAFKDDDDERSSEEIYLDTKESLSKFQTRGYIHFIDGKKNENGEYTTSKIAVAQPLVPFYALLSNLYDDAIRLKLGREPKGIKYALDEFYEGAAANLDPFGVSDPAKLGTKNPIIKALVTYQSGYDFFKDQALEGTTEKLPRELEGYKSKNIQDFFKLYGEISGMSPSRTKAAVEAMLTSPDTNPFLGMTYASVDAITGYDSKFTDKKSFVKSVVGSFAKRVTAETSEFNRLQNAITAENRKTIEEAAVKEKKLDFIADYYIKEYRKNNNKDVIINEGIPAIINNQYISPLRKGQLIDKMTNELGKTGATSVKISSIKYDTYGSVKGKAEAILIMFGKDFTKDKEAMTQLAQAGLLTTDVMYEISQLKKSKK